MTKLASWLLLTAIIAAYQTLLSLISAPISLIGPRSFLLQSFLMGLCEYTQICASHIRKPPTCRERACGVQLFIAEDCIKLPYPMAYQSLHHTERLQYPRPTCFDST